MPEHPIPLPEPVAGETLPTALAPMQDVTDLAFMRLLGKYGPPDYFVTEYFRVHEHSTLEKPIVDSILHHGTGRPVFAQMIGEDRFHLRRTALELQKLPVAGIDLNMGCPAPKVYRKNVGGGLLRDPATVDRILGTLREACPGRFSVKMRVGFEDARHFETILGLAIRHRVDFLSIHGRTVKQMYRGEVDYTRIRMAAQTVPCPVFANGNITSARKAAEVAAFTGCHGVMVGRSAIRNPWIFRQIRERGQGSRDAGQGSRDAGQGSRVTLGDVRTYVDDLWGAIARPGMEDTGRLNRMKKFLNFVGQGIDAEGRFLHEMRRARSAGQLFAICDRHMVDNDQRDKPFAGEPYAGIHARPNHEAARDAC